MDEINKTEKKPKFWKRKIGVFGKQIPVVAVLLVLVGGLGGAALLEYFGQIQTTAEVEQAVTLLGNPEHTIPEDAPGGERFCYLHKLDNKASVDIDVGFETEIAGPGGCLGAPQAPCEQASPKCIWDASIGKCIEAGITTTINSIPETRTLELCKKDPTTWQCVAGPTATLTFDPVSPTFDYELVAMNLVGSTEYALIYYADDDPRFQQWGGDNPGAIIDIFSTDTSGNYNSGSKSVDLGMNLPASPDWNINPIPDYCDLHNGFDDYEHCKGAKLWIVETNDLTDPTGTPKLPLTTWNPNAWLFEEDLIVYSDCNLTPENFAVDMEVDVSVNTLTTKSRDKTPMLVCYDFDVAIAEGTYVITTDIVP